MSKASHSQAWKPKDTNRRSRGAKIQLREKALAWVGESGSVFDAFCGHGEMWRSVWSRADHYVGCDARQLERGDPPRFVCDNLMLMGLLDLQPFNVFDFDAYGSPWPQLVMLARRRSVAPGEHIAVVTTDGGAMNGRWGNRDVGLRDLIGVEEYRGNGIGVDAYRTDEAVAMKEFTARLGCLLVDHLRAECYSTGQGSVGMRYELLCLEGLGGPNSVQ